MMVIIAILAFGVLILVHEFGHFVVAKLNGIGVVEFSIGMGPRLISFTKGETMYSLRILPFGGSCMMVGEDGSDPDPRAFNNKPVWSRIAVVAAGPFFNFILAFVLGLIIVHAAGYDSPQLIDVQEGFPAQEAGMQAGDIITKMNRDHIVVYRDISLYLYIHPSDTVTVEYKRPLSNGTYEKRSAVITPKYSEEYDKYMIGIVVSGGYQPVHGFFETIKYGAYEVIYSIKTVIRSLEMLVTGKVGMNDIAGPVRMVSIIDETVEEAAPYGWQSVALTLMDLILLLSANLGVMNLLPIPALDGGRLLFLIIELVRGKPVPPEKEGMIHMIGMAFLMVFMVIVLFHDIFYVFFS